MKRFTIPLGRYVLAFALAMAVLVLPITHLIAQVADSTAAGGPLNPLIGLATVVFTAAGTAIYQLIKKGISPLDKLPAPVHMAIVIGANFLWQYFAPWISAHVGSTVPGDLHQIGPAAITGVLMGLAMMGAHKLWQLASGWIAGKFFPHPA